MTNRNIIRNRLKANGPMSGLELVKVGKEKAHGLLDTVKIMVESGEIVKTENGLYALPKSRSFSIKPSEKPSKEEFGQMVRGYPNWMIAIGFTGIFKCYLNLEIEDAIKRYETANNEEIDDSITIDVVLFDDEMSAYQIWEAD